MLCWCRRSRQWRGRSDPCLRVSGWVRIPYAVTEAEHVRLFQLFFSCSVMFGLKLVCFCFFCSPTNYVDAWNITFFQMHFLIVSTPASHPGLPPLAESSVDVGVLSLFSCLETDVIPVQMQTLSAEHKSPHSLTTTCIGTAENGERNLLQPRLK